MKIFLRFLLSFLLFSFLATSLRPVIISAEELLDNVELTRLINEKNVELKKIQEEREKLEKNLNKVLETKGALSKEVKTLEYNIQQLDLSINSNRLAAQKFELELDSLGRDIRSIDNGVKEKKITIGRLLTEMSFRDREPFFVTFLKFHTLGEGIGELETLYTLNNDLRLGIRQLQGFQEELAEKVADVQVKKKQREIEKANLANRQFIIKDQKEEKQKLLVQTKDQEKVYAEQIDELERQQGEISKTIDEIEYKLRESFDPTLLPLKRSGVLAMPVLNAKITQGYGNTKFAERAYKSKFHNGIDFGVPLGTPIFAAEDGTIKASYNNDKGTVKWLRYQYGLYIVVEHENNLSTLYAHLSRVLVRAGDKVKRGDLIGYSGNSGYSTGPHLHFTVFWTQGIQFKAIPPAAGLVPVGVTVDPRDYL